MIYTRGIKGRKVCYFRFTLAGVEYRRSTHQADREVAKSLEAEFRSKLVQGGIKAADPRKVPTLSSFTEKFIAYCVRENCIKDSTRKFYENSLRRLSESRTLAGVPIAKIDSALFSQYVEERLESKRQTGQYTTLQAELRVLKVLLNYAWKIGEIPSVPGFIAPGKGIDRTREYIPDEETFTKFIQAAGEGVLRDAAILSASTGMRPGEIASLTTSQVAATDDGFVIALKEAKSTAGKKPIFVSSGNARAACDVLQRRIENIPAGVTDGMVFWELTGPTKEARVDALSKMHTRLRDSLKMPDEFIFYSFRHLYVTMAVLTLKDVAAVKELARHADVKTTMIYFNPRDEHRRAIASNVKLLTPPSTEPA